MAFPLTRSTILDWPFRRLRHALLAVGEVPDQDCIASIPAGIVIAFFYMVLGWIYGAILIATHRTNLAR
jgi:hypothetical protein